MRYWNGYQWKRISNVEARLRRGRGEDVIDDDAVEAPAVEPVASQIVPAPAVAIALPGVTSTALAARIEARESAAADLTDDELERLTAPSGEG